MNLFCSESIKTSACFRVGRARPARVFLNSVNFVSADSVDRTSPNKKNVSSLEAGVRIRINANSLRIKILAVRFAFLERNSHKLPKFELFVSLTIVDSFWMIFISDRSFGN